MRTALVVEDSMLVRHALCRWLEQRGFATHSACNGAEALHMVPLVSPDIIFTDDHMPLMDGNEFVDQLRRDPKTAEIPVIILASRQGGAQILNTQANATIFKDNRINDELERAVHGALTIVPPGDKPAS